MHRAANRILRDALAGRPIKLAFCPPDMAGVVRWDPAPYEADAAPHAGSEEEVEER